MQSDMYKYFRYHFILVLAFVFMAGNILAQSGDKEDENLIRQARKLSNEAIAKKDSNALAEIWTDDYHLLSSRSIELSGKENNRHLFAQDFTSAHSKLFVRSTTHIDIFPAWNMAAENGNWTGHWKEADGDVNISGTYYAKWHKINGQWKIRAEIFVPISCSGSKYCRENPF
jgi:ketosteroid isomerase-like protein